MGAEPTDEARAILAASPSMEGLDLASTVTRDDTRIVGGEGSARHTVVAYDFGIKENIVRLMVENGCKVIVVPARTSAKEALAHKPDGVFLSNGPGDPAAVSYAPATIREIAATKTPIFGICLGHQILGLAFGGETVKLPYGHRGGNHPVKDLETGKVLITSQNHGFALKGEEGSQGRQGQEGLRGVPGAPKLRVTHRNLNDGTVEGVRHLELPVFAVQYHPEASPGPHDARAHFADFIRLMTPTS
jgi:carbamoyl-phosphate synthase small subunit